MVLWCLFVAENLRLLPVLDTASAGGSERGRFLADHPFLATTAGVALVGSGCIVVAPAIALGALNLVGFGASGPVAG